MDRLNLKIAGIDPIVTTACGGPIAALPRAGRQDVQPERVVIKLG